MKFAIVVGHSSEAMGAFSPHLKKHEYEVWKDFATDLWRHAKEQGLDPQIFLRDGRTIKKVGEEVSKFGGVAIELHFNSYSDIHTRGAETLYDVDPSGAKSFAGFVHKEVLKALTETNPLANDVNEKNPFKKPKDRGLKLVTAGDRGYMNLQSVKLPSCLIEPFFGTNRLDCELFTRCRAALIKGLTHAVVDWYLLQSKL